MSNLMTTVVSSIEELDTHFSLSTFVECLINKGTEKHHSTYSLPIDKSSGVSMFLADKHVKYYGSISTDDIQVIVRTAYIPKNGARFDLAHEITSVNGKLIARASLVYLFQDKDERLLLEEPSTFVKWKESYSIVSDN